MRQQTIWMAIVAFENEVVFTKGCKSKRDAERAIVKHIRQQEGFEGRNFGEVCFYIGEKGLRLDLMIFEMKRDDFPGIQLQDGLLIEPPPNQKNLSRVVYSIDVDASGPHDAAEYVYQIMTDPDSLPPLLEVIDSKGNKVEIDLSNESQTAVLKEQSGTANNSAAELLEAFKTLTSYVSDMFYQMNDQVDIEEIDEIRQAREAILNYEANHASREFELMLREQSPGFEDKSIRLHLSPQDDQLWIRPDGYGEKDVPNGEGSPIGLVIWQGRLRLIVFADINRQEPQIIDLENAKEPHRRDTAQ